LRHCGWTGARGAKEYQISQNPGKIFAANTQGHQTLSLELGESTRHCQKKKLFNAYSSPAPNFISTV